LRKASLKTAIEKKDHFFQGLIGRGALEHQHWTLEDWGRVNWSHGTNINRMGSNGRAWVWKKPGSGLKHNQISGLSTLGADS